MRCDSTRGTTRYRVVPWSRDAVRSRRRRVKLAIVFASIALCIAIALPRIRQWRAERKLKDLWAALRRRTRDPEVAARLVAGERERHPGLSEAACVRRALRQLARDRR